MDGYAATQNERRKTEAVIVSMTAPGPEEATRDGQRDQERLLRQIKPAREQLVTADARALSAQLPSAASSAATWWCVGAACGDWE